MYMCSLYVYFCSISSVFNVFFSKFSPNEHDILILYTIITLNAYIVTKLIS